MFTSSPFIPDSEENFLSLRQSSKHKEANGCKQKKDSDTKETKSKQVKSPKVKSLSPTGEAKKNAISPTPTKPHTPKRTPTSVADYFGSSTTKRSDKKLVASTSTKRKAVSTAGFSADSVCTPFILPFVSFSSSLPKTQRKHVRTRPSRNSYRWTRTWRWVRPDGMITLCSWLYRLFII